MLPDHLIPGPQRVHSFRLQSVGGPTRIGSGAAKPAYLPDSRSSAADGDGTPASFRNRLRNRAAFFSVPGNGAAMIYSVSFDPLSDSGKPNRRQPGRESRLPEQRSGGDDRKFASLSGIGLAGTQHGARYAPARDLVTRARRCNSFWTDGAEETVPSAACCVSVTNWTALRTLSARRSIQKPVSIVYLVYRSQLPVIGSRRDADSGGQLR